MHSGRKQQEELAVAITTRNQPNILVIGGDGVLLAEGG
jgi:hypothetical protein